MNIHYCDKHKKYKNKYLNLQKYQKGGMMVNYIKEYSSDDELDEELKKVPGFRPSVLSTAPYGIRAAEISSDKRNKIIETFSKMTQMISMGVAAVGVVTGIATVHIGVGIPILVASCAVLLGLWTLANWYQSNEDLKYVSTLILDQLTNIQQDLFYLQLFYMVVDEKELELQNLVHKEYSSIEDLIISLLPRIPDIYSSEYEIIKGILEKDNKSYTDIVKIYEYVNTIYPEFFTTYPIIKNSIMQLKKIELMKKSNNMYVNYLADKIYYSLYNLFCRHIDFSLLQNQAFVSVHSNNPDIKMRIIEYIEDYFDFKNPYYIKNTDGKFRYNYIESSKNKLRFSTEKNRNNIITGNFNESNMSYNDLIVGCVFHQYEKLCPEDTTVKKTIRETLKSTLESGLESGLTRLRYVRQFFTINTTLKNMSRDYSVLVGFMAGALLRYINQRNMYERVFSVEDLNKRIEALLNKINIS